MREKTPKGLIAVFVILFILVVDQASKIWVKTNMALYDSIEITKWFKIYFVENNGMAFGIEAIGKLFLSVFRIIAVVFIGVYLHKIIKKNYKVGFIICISMVLAGAFGNIIDSVFYGEIFTASYPGHIASFVPIGEGYSSWLHGKVVDMLYFPLIETTLPTWVPFFGGSEILFFRFIFNLADASISVGVAILLLFYRKTLSHSLQTEKEKKSQQLN
ncbi:MAG TPA: lipoprotein signal peptidase [Dysgonamonadaceae bacterium]|nr:lipoprotein signal peptidase [Dysgonamonadaceae bacterium]